VIEPEQPPNWRLLLVPLKSKTTFPPVGTSTVRPARSLLGSSDSIEQPDADRPETLCLMRQTILYSREKDVSPREIVPNFVAVDKK
jgi:hypothetical protein